MKITITWRNDNPDTIWNKLVSKLGRDPTTEEATAEISRILDDGMSARAGRGELGFQRGRMR